MRIDRAALSTTIQRMGPAAANDRRRSARLVVTALLAGVISAPALASPQECGRLWVERNAFFAKAGFCHDSALWQRSFPGGTCSIASSGDVPLAEADRTRIAEIREREHALGCKVDPRFADPTEAARRLLVAPGDIASVQGTDAKVNIRDQPDAEAGKVVDELADGHEVQILRRVANPRNKRHWLEVRYWNGAGASATGFVSHTLIGPRTSITGTLRLTAGGDLVTLFRQGPQSRVAAQVRIHFTTVPRAEDVGPVLFERDYRPLSRNDGADFDVDFSGEVPGHEGQRRTAHANCRWNEARTLATCHAGQERRRFYIAGSWEVEPGRRRGSLSLIVGGPQAESGFFILEGPAGDEPGTVRYRIASKTGVPVRLPISLRGLTDAQPGPAADLWPSVAVSGEASSPPRSQAALPKAAATAPAAAPPVPAPVAEAFKLQTDLLDWLD